MGKSYRKPYSAVTGTSSAHQDKTQAARSVRRAQNLALQNAFISQIDWNEFLIPDIYECADNEVYGWGRDGNQYLQTRGKQYNNPYAYSRYNCWTEEQILEMWEESKKRTDDWLKSIVRK